MTRPSVLFNLSLSNTGKQNQVTWNIEQNRKPFLCMYLETFFINSKYLCRKGFLLPLSKTSFYTLAIQNFLGQMGSLQGLQILCLKGGKWVLLTNKASQVSGSTDPKKVIMSLHLARPEQTKEPKLKEKPKEDHTNIKIHIIKICDTNSPCFLINTTVIMLTHKNEKTDLSVKNFNLSFK